MTDEELELGELDNLKDIKNSPINLKQQLKEAFEAGAKHQDAISRKDEKKKIILTIKHLAYKISGHEIPLKIDLNQFLLLLCDLEKGESK